MALSQIKEEFENLKGQFVISGNEVYRLIGIAQDDHDYYWCLYDGRSLKLPTCVGRVIPLKGYIRDKDYDHFVHIARLNHFDQETLWANSEPEKFRELAEEHKRELFKDWGVPTEWGATSMVTEVFWDIV